MSERKPVITVTIKDCDCSYYVGPGNGGQKKQKTKSGVMISHKPSSAQARDHSTRSQAQNKTIAFKKLANSPEMQKWLKIETMKKLGQYQAIELEVEKQMQEKNLKIEYGDSFE